MERDARRAQRGAAGRPAVDVYTDGACRGNPGPGGWAAILLYGQHRRELSGGERRTTNQRMELTAVIEALKALRRPCRVRIHSDSAYVVNAFQRSWVRRWQANGWRTAAGKPVDNQDLWQELLRVGQEHEIEWVKVAGHAGDPWNERADALARAAIPDGTDSGGAAGAATTPRRRDGGLS